MESIIEIFNLVAQFLNAVADFTSASFGVNIFLVFPVFFIVSFIKKGIKDIYSTPLKSFYTYLMCLLVSFLICVLNYNYPSFSSYLLTSVNLGAMSSFSYGILKGFYKAMIFKIVKKIKDKTGKDVKIESDIVG